ncbi:hypothetical protein [Asaia prunellae]|uniref:hypothetical protein n=1 Tax=Asaia prunellae TaxID=610245 RepID=UPI0011DCF456|nr:hypothetical protein [Asaia prunellae]
MIKSFVIASILSCYAIFLSKTYADDTKCYFPDIPSFSEGKTLPNGQPADLSFADYRTLNPQGAALLLRCAKTLYKNADLSQFNDTSRKRLDRTMNTTWQEHDTSATAQKDGYIALGGSSKIGSANDLGTMIIGPDKKLVAIGLLFNEKDGVGDNEPLNYFSSNFLFIYYFTPFEDKKPITISKISMIIDTINKNIYDRYVLNNEYFIGSRF